MRYVRPLETDRDGQAVTRMVCESDRVYETGNLVGAQVMRAISRLPLR
jgi:hypothetical protein